jgi:hypothetical protein
VARITSGLHEEQYTFFIISRSLLLGMRNVSEKCCRENKNAHFIFSNLFFENRAVYELLWKKYSASGHATDDIMAHAHCMPDT